MVHWINHLVNNDAKTQRSVSLCQRQPVINARGVLIFGRFLACMPSGDSVFAIKNYRIGKSQIVLLTPFRRSHNLRPVTENNEERILYQRRFGFNPTAYSMRQQEARTRLVNHS